MARISERRQLLVAAELVLAATLVVSCGGGNAPTRNSATPPATTATPLSSGQSSHVPTLVLTATPLVVGPDVRHCRGSDLQVELHPPGPTQHQILSILLANRSDTPCQISRLPELQFLNAAGSVIPIKMQSGGECQAGGFCRTGVAVLLLPHIGSEYVNGVLRPGPAALSLFWAEAQTCSTPPLAAATKVKLVLDDGYYLIVGIPAGPGVSRDFGQRPVGAGAPCGPVQVQFG